MKVFAIAAVWLLVAGCATPRVVHLDTGQRSLLASTKGFVEGAQGGSVTPSSWLTKLLAVGLVIAYTSKPNV